MMRQLGAITGFLPSFGDANGTARPFTGFYRVLPSFSVP